MQARHRRRARGFEQSTAAEKSNVQELRGAFSHFQQAVPRKSDKSRGSMWCSRHNLDAPSMQLLNLAHLEAKGCLKEPRGLVQTCFGPFSGFDRTCYIFTSVTTASLEQLLCTILWISKSQRNQGRGNCVAAQTRNWHGDGGFCAPFGIHCVNGFFQILERGLMDS